MNQLFTTHEPKLNGNMSTGMSSCEQTARPLLPSSEYNEARVRMENGRASRLYFQRFLTI